MAEYPGVTSASVFDVEAILPGRAPGAYQGTKQDSDPIVTLDEPAVLDPSATLLGVREAGPGFVAPAVSTYPGYFNGTEATGKDWYESFHVLSRSYDFGNVISAQSQALVVYNAYRRTNQTVTGIVNNLGDGTTVGGSPTLPATVAFQSQLDLTIDVAVSGAASVDSTIDFTFGTGMTISVPVTLSRLVFFSVPPEMPYTEILEFLTDIRTHLDGTEQRAALRKNPRQSFNFTYLVEEGTEQSIIDNIIFDWQHRLFGVPVWHELTRLTSTASIGTTTINVGDTDYADFRDNTLLVLFDSQTNFEVIEIDSHTSTTITLKSATTIEFTEGTIVAPLRLAEMTTNISGRRFSVNLSSRSITFTVTDNDSNIGAIAAGTWPTTFNSKVVFDDDNGIGNQLTESFQRRFTRIDNRTGKATQLSQWTRGKRVSAKTFYASGRQAVWETRQAVHFHKGRLTSFYLPTFWNDLTPETGIASGSNTIDIVHVGYTRFVQSRQPWNTIRITFVDGTTPIIHTITSSEEVDSDTERLTVTPSWPSTQSLANIEKIMFVEEARFDSDRITFQHELGNRLVRISAPVKTVFE